MARQIVLSPRVVPYRSAMVHAVKAGGFVFTSGVVPWRSERGDIAKGDFAAQLHQVMHNLICILEDSGSSLDKAVKITVAMTDMSNFAVFDEIYRSYFKDGDMPARMTSESPRLAHPDHMIVMDCIATL